MSLHPAPPRHFRPQSERQRLETLRRIDAAEREALPSIPGPLTPDPYLLRLVKTEKPVQIAKPLAVDVPTKPIGRRQLAINTYSVYRKAGHGVRAALRQFFRVLARNS